MHYMLMSLHYNIYNIYILVVQIAAFVLCDFILIFL
jgi:hypothetical protein